MTLRFSLAVVASSILLTACATTHEKYAWGSYEHSLYVYYKNPAKADALSMSLEAIITGADKTKAIVAPGIYAEYGYLLLQQGKAQEAVSEFKLEEQHWPESRIFMDRMIQVASSQTATSTKEH